MANFGPLMAEIASGTPANFNGFRVLAALLHGTLVVGVEQRAPRIFVRAAITLDIGPHSSFFFLSLFLFFPRLFSAVGDFIFTILPDMMWP